MMDCSPKNSHGAGGSQGRSSSLAPGISGCRRILLSHLPENPWNTGTGPFQGCLGPAGLSQLPDNPWDTGAAPLQGFLDPARLSHLSENPWDPGAAPTSGVLEAFPSLKPEKARWNCPGIVLEIPTHLGVREEGKSSFPKFLKIHL